MRAKFLIAVALLFSCAVSSFSKEKVLKFSSRKRKAALLELYTSEGCSSCPPADRWLRKLTQASGLWHDFVPLGFHVDYWDRLGWYDRKRIWLRYRT